MSMLYDLLVTASTGVIIYSAYTTILYTVNGVAGNEVKFIGMVSLLFASLILCYVCFSLGGELM